MPSNIWTYSGEAGKRLDSTVRPFDLPGAQVAFPALATEVWRWAVDLADIVPATEPFPEKGQVVSLVRNGVRFFRGHAMMPRQDGYKLGIQVVGPWHWMEKIPLSKAVTLDAASGGGSGQRATLGFPAQSLTTSLGTLIDRMIALGVPIVKGTIATTFNSIPITVNQGSCAQALTDLVRKVGDMAVWFDHSGSGFPILNITRRKTGLSVGTAAAVTLDVSQLAPEFQCIPEDDWRVSQVRVPYLDRAPNGSRRNQEQKSGTEETGHVLLLTASGEELDSFLPEEKLDSVNIRTLATNATTAQFLDFLNTADPLLANLRQKYGFAWYGGNVVGQYLTTHAVASGASLPYLNTKPTGSTTMAQLPTTAPMVKINGTPIVGTKHIVTSADAIPDWMRTENGITVHDAELVCEVFVTLQWDETDFPGGQPDHIPGLVEFAGQSGGLQNRYNTFGNTYDRISHFIYTSTVRVKLIDASYPALSTVYRQPSYTFIAPPAGFATGILEARNWTPHVGSVSLVEEECGATRYLGKVLNITGADPSFASMRAMIQSETLDLDSGTTRLALGPPAVLEFGTLLDQQETNPNQQIVYL
jgi:hypothetical protein